jgi:hypothetical protein
MKRCEKRRNINIEPSLKTHYLAQEAKNNIMEEKITQHSNRVRKFKNHIPTPKITYVGWEKFYAELFEVLKIA